MIYLAVVIGMVVICVLIGPFFVGPGGLLQAGSSVNDPAILRAMKEAILRRYLEDEAAHTRGALSAVGWNGRKAYLTHRYIDAARRLDFVENAVRLSAAVPVSGTEAAQ